MSVVIGKPLDRVDGRLKVTGAAHYTADIPITDVTYGVIIESTIALGRVTQIDTRAAESAPGVLGIITHLNAPSLHEVEMFPFGPAGQTLLPLQDEVIHYSGQHIGIVVADTLERAMHAATLVEISYQEETPIPTLKDGLARGEQVCEVTGFFEKFNETRGDLKQGIAEAFVCIDQTYSTPVNHHNPMETSATIATWDSDSLTLYDSTQWIFGARNAIATTFGLPQENVRIISHFVGGAFGCKCFTWSHVILAAIAARHVGKPVKVVLSREQMFTSVGYRASTSQHLILGATKEGKLTAISHEGTSQTSTFAEYVLPVGEMTRILYACPNLSVKHQIMRVNAGTPTQMRAPGEAPGMFALESAMDELAYALELDPIELRLRNHADVHPGSTGAHRPDLLDAGQPTQQSGLPWSSKSLVECYKSGAERFEWKRRNPKPCSMRDGDYLVGLGMATATYPVYLSPAAARVKLFASGHALAQSGTHELGNGTYTVMTQIAAEELGLPCEKVRFELGDTQLPVTPVTGASRTVSSVGPAVQAAAAATRSKVIQMAIADAASPLFGCESGQIAAKDGRLFLVQQPSRGETYGDILNRHGLDVIEAYQETLPIDADQTDRNKVFSGINAIRGPVTSKFAMYNFGAHFAEVRVNRRSGEVRLSRFVGAFAAGRILNPKTAHSQLLGGIIFGIGMALMEETVTDSRLGRIVTANLADYHLPVHADITEIEAFFIEEHDPHVNSLGTKSVGELGIVGSAAAIANAVYHATGKRVRDLPIALEKLL